MRKTAVRANVRLLFLVTFWNFFCFSVFGTVLRRAHPRSKAVQGQQRKILFGNKIPYNIAVVHGLRLRFAHACDQTARQIPAVRYTGKFYRIFRGGFDPQTETVFSLNERIRICIHSPSSHSAAVKKCLFSKTTRLYSILLLMSIGCG